MPIGNSSLTTTHPTISTSGVRAMTYIDQVFNFTNGLGSGFNAVSVNNTQCGGTFSNGLDSTIGNLTPSFVITKTNTTTPAVCFAVVLPMNPVFSNVGIPQGKTVYGIQLFNTDEKSSSTNRVDFGPYVINIGGVSSEISLQALTINPPTNTWASRKGTITPLNLTLGINTNANVNVTGRIGDGLSDSTGQWWIDNVTVRFYYTNYISTTFVAFSITHPTFAASGTVNNTILPRVASSVLSKQTTLSSTGTRLVPVFLGTATLSRNFTFSSVAKSFISLHKGNSSLTINHPTTTSTTFVGLGRRVVTKGFGSNQKILTRGYSQAPAYFSSSDIIVNKATIISSGIKIGLSNSAVLSKSVTMSSSGTMLALYTGNGVHVISKLIQSSGLFSIPVRTSTAILLVNHPTITSQGVRTIYAIEFNGSVILICHPIFSATGSCIKGIIYQTRYITSNNSITRLVKSNAIINFGIVNENAGTVYLYGGGKCSHNPTF